MNARQTATLAMLERVHDFVTAIPPAPTALPQLVTQLEEAIARAKQAASTQGAGTTKVTAAQRAALRRTLRARYLVPIRHVARVLSRTTPGLDNIVQLPKKVASEAALLAAAKAAAVDVTPYQAAFVAKGLVPDFVVQLNAAIAAVEQAVETNVMAKRQKLMSTADLKAAMTDGRDLIISLDHVVQAACDQDTRNGAATRSTWAHIRHVHSASAAPLSMLSLAAVSPSSSMAPSSAASTPVAPLLTSAGALQ